MKVILPVVGIRNYYTEEEKHLPTEAERLASVFRRVPVGSTVYLRRKTDSEFENDISASVSPDGGQVGNVKDILTNRIIPAIDCHGWVTAIITEQSYADKSFLVEVENDVGSDPPCLKQYEALEGEFVLPFTSDDSLLMDVQKRARELFDSVTAKEQPTAEERDELMSTLKKYAEYCCKSIDGETKYYRQTLLFDMEQKVSRFPELEAIRRDIFEKDKDLGRCTNDVNVRTYKEQLMRLRQAAYTIQKGAQYNRLDTYLLKLRMADGGQLPRHIAEDERKALGELLATALKGQYAALVSNDANFVSQLYQYKYDMKSLYVLFSRMIRYDYLTKKLNGEKPDASAEPSYAPCPLSKTKENENNEAVKEALRVLLKGKRALCVKKYIQVAVEEGFLDEEPSYPEIQEITGLGTTRQNYSKAIVKEMSDTERNRILERINKAIEDTKMIDIG